jgi:hypothetical protein
VSDIFGTGFESSHGAGMESPHNQMRGYGVNINVAGGIGLYVVNGTSSAYEATRLSGSPGTSNPLAWVNREGISSGSQTIHCVTAFGHRRRWKSGKVLFGGNITIIGGVGPINFIASYDPNTGTWLDAGYESFESGIVKKFWSSGYFCGGENLTYKNGKQYPVYRLIGTPNNPQWVPYIDGYQDPDSQRFANSLNDDRNHGTMVANDMYAARITVGSRSVKEHRIIAVGRFTNSEGTSKIIYASSTSIPDRPILPWKIEPNFSDGTANCVTTYVGYSSFGRDISIIGGDFDDEDGSASNNALYNPFGVHRTWTIFHRPHGATSVINDMGNNPRRAASAPWVFTGYGQIADVFDWVKKRGILFASSGTQFGDTTSNYIGYLELDPRNGTGTWFSDTNPDHSAGITGEVKSLLPTGRWTTHSGWGNSYYKAGTSIGNSLLAGYDGHTYAFTDRGIAESARILWSGTEAWSAIGDAGGTVSGATDMAWGPPTPAS